MSEIKPNHICKNRLCAKGPDGGRKHYYACNFCDKHHNWRSVACSFECYLAYMEQVSEARNKGNDLPVAPERTDMTKKEIEELINMPDDIVIAQTKEQLRDYINADGSVDFARAVDEINRELDEKAISAHS